MHTLIHSLPLRRIVVEQLPIALTALLLAELFYKFHSFTLEVIAFLATWYLLDAGVDALRMFLRGRR